MPPYPEQTTVPFSRDTQEEQVPPDPEEVKANLSDASSQLSQPPETVEPKPIPQSYFDASKPSLLDRMYKYGREVDDAFLRATANNIVPSFDAGDRFAAQMGAWRGIDGNRGDYEGNLKRQRINSELAGIKSPIATIIGTGAGSSLGGGLLGKSPTIQGAIRGVLKDRPLPPSPPRGIPLRSPPKPRGRFNDY
jgi:hypothetical protein